MASFIQAGVDADFDDTHFVVVEVLCEPVGGHQRAGGNGGCGQNGAAQDSARAQHGGAQPGAHARCLGGPYSFHPRPFTICVMPCTGCAGEDEFSEGCLSAQRTKTRLVMQNFNFAAMLLHH